MAASMNNIDDKKTEIYQLIELMKAELNKVKADLKDELDKVNADAKSCGRSMFRTPRQGYGRYRRDRLIYGRNAKLIDWLGEIIADCPMKIAHNDPCGARCPDLARVL